MAQLCQDENMLRAAAEGKDLYAEVAAASFHTTYENCLEFFPKGTPIKEVDGEWVIAEKDDCDKLADGEKDTNYAGKERRSQAKAILLGILYGRQEQSIAEQLRCSVEEAREIKQSVFDAFPAIKKFEDDSIAFAKKNGFVTTLWGRRRRLPDMQLPDYSFEYEEGYSPKTDVLNFEDGKKLKVSKATIDEYTKRLDNAKFKERFNIVDEALAKDHIKIRLNTKAKSDATRQVVNSRIQGSAADMSKKAMIAVAENEEFNELGGRLLIVVHDEIIIECPKKNAKRVEKLFAELMSNCATDKLTIPIKCDVTTSECWYGKEYEFEITDEEE